MSLRSDDDLTIPEHVLFQRVSGESVLLDLDNEQYFGLDEIGTRIWQLIAEHGRLGDVYAAMLDEYEVPADVLERDLADLVQALTDKGLLVHSADCDP